MKTYKNYKEYADKYEFPTDVSGDTVLGEEFSLDGLIKFNAEGKLDLSMEAI